MYGQAGVTIGSGSVLAAGVTMGSNLTAGLAALVLVGALVNIVITTIRRKGARP